MMCTLQKLVFVAGFLIGGFFALHSAETDESSAAMNTLVDVLFQVDDPESQLEMLRGIQEELRGRRSMAMPKAWPALSAKLLKSSHADVRALALSLGVVFGDYNAFAALREALQDQKAPVATRQNALSALLGAKDLTLPPVLHKLLDDAVVRSSALRALAAYDDPKTPVAILGVYPNLTAAEKRDALNTLAARLLYARELLSAIANKKIAASDVTADLIRQLKNLNDQELDKQITSVWGTVRATPEEKLAEIAKIKTLVTNPQSPNPNLQNGRAAFSRTCQQCHTLFAVGGKIGPDITGSNRADLDYLLQNILDPNAVVGKDYLVTNVFTKDGQVLSGILAKQDNDAVTLVTVTETTTIPRKEIESLRPSELSMMPDGLIANLTEAEIRDLIGYLRSPSQVPLVMEKK